MARRSSENLFDDVEEIEREEELSDSESGISQLEQFYNILNAAGLEYEESTNIKADTMLILNNGIGIGFDADGNLLSIEPNVDSE